MGYIKQKTDLRVVVYPRDAGDFGACRMSGVERTEKEEEALCNEIASQILRHVNDVVSARVIWKTEMICEHCGASWSEGEDSLHNGGCCDEDAKAYFANEVEAPHD